MASPPRGVDGTIGPGIPTLRLPPFGISHRILTPTNLERPGCLAQNGHRRLDYRIKMDCLWNQQDDNGF